jgi:hypothetical protein
MSLCLTRESQEKPERDTLNFRGGQGARQILEEAVGLEWEGSFLREGTTQGMGWNAELNCTKEQ